MGTEKNGNAFGKDRFGIHDASTTARLLFRFAVASDERHIESFRESDRATRGFGEEIRGTARHDTRTVQHDDIARLSLPGREL